MWSDKIIEAIQSSGHTKLIINDSKTPSGKVHVGSLRGVLLHDAIKTLAQQADIDAEFIYGVDDFDPMDGLPADADAELSAHMGKPLFSAPSPDASYTDLADFYISEFFDLV